MKKLLFLSVILSSCVILSNAFAECTVLSCDSISWYESLGWLQTTKGGDQCWACGPIAPRACSSGDVVPYMNANGEIISLYQCTYGFSNSFEKFNPGTLCEDSPIRNTSAANTTTIYKPVGQKTTKTEIGDVKFFTGSSFCKYIYCTGNRAASSDQQKCIDVNSNCKDNTGKALATGTIADDVSCTNSTYTKISSPLMSSEYIATGKTCSAKCETNGWNITLKNDTCQEDYEPDATKKKCVLSAAAQQRQQQQQKQKQQQQNRDNKTKCENSGGTWKQNKCSCDTAKNLRLDNGECKCSDDVNYKRSADGKSCDLTDAAALEKNCLAAAGAGAIWDGTRCTCGDIKKIWNGTTCVVNPNVANCEAVAGAKWSNGQCVCADSNKEMNADGTECVETEAARKKREEAEKLAEQTAAKERITSISSKINTLKSGLNTSVWKNKEGNFNTSRLVSDSVAGVVLGTAGGLITSNIIKKNQIKGGFEDISCTIRGQTVAGYGDDFQVGIQ